MFHSIILYPPSNLRTTLVYTCWISIFFPSYLYFSPKFKNYSYISILLFLGLLFLFSIFLVFFHVVSSYDASNFAIIYIIDLFIFLPKLSWTLVAHTQPLMHISFQGTCVSTLCFLYKYINDYLICPPIYGHLGYSVIWIIQLSQ